MTYSSVVDIEIAVFDEGQAVCALYVDRSHIGFTYAVKLYRSLQPQKILKFLLGKKFGFLGGLKSFLLLYSFSLVCVVDRHG